MSACETPLLKYSAKEYFFKAALCRFCLSTDDARNAIERLAFQPVDFSFQIGFSDTKESFQHLLILANVVF